MNEKLKVIIENNQSVMKIPTGVRMLIRRCCKAVLALEGFTDSAEISVTIVDDATIHELNLKHRGIDRSTDVLSFPLGENGEYDTNMDTGAKMLGDIVISIEHAYEQAEKYGHSQERELAFLIAHSMLHLCGYDHMEEGEREVMEQKQREILEGNGYCR